MKVLILDNFDSFTYNLYQYAGEILQKQGGSFVVDVIRNNEITVDEIRGRGYERIIISPGPGSPDDPIFFGVCAEVIVGLGEEVPILGVCLGMQGIAHYLGGMVIRAKKPMHGKISRITHDGVGVFAGLPQDLEVMRYHSLVVERDSLPETLEITAVSQDSDEIMGLRHREYPIEGIQFHPESFGTEGGKKMLENFLFQKYAGNNK